MFEYYFEPLGDVLYEDIIKNENYIRASYSHVLDFQKAFGYYDDTKVYSEYVVDEEFLKYLGSIARKYVKLKDLGIAVLGLNSTFASVLNALSLAELGFQTAVVYSLYKPLHDEDHKTINDIVNIFKIVYRFVGIFFVCASFIVLPFLKYILSDIPVNNTIYVYFLLQASASAASYFIAYKRTLLYADQKDYIAKTIDIISFSVFSILEILVIILFESYTIYLVLRFVQVVIANGIIQIECNKRYPYLHRAKTNKIILKKVLLDVKGRSCFDVTIVSGYRRVPAPPAKIIPFTGNTSVTFGICLIIY